MGDNGRTLDEGTFEVWWEELESIANGDWCLSRD